MASTKRQIVEQAFEELALASYAFDLSPEELQAALQRLDALMATWSAQGMRLPYAFGGELDTDSGLPAVANEAVYLALAQRIAAGKGKMLPVSLNIAARDAKSALLTLLAHQQMVEQQMPDGMPRGAGQKTWRGTQRPFFNAPDTKPLQTADDGGLNFTGG